jgi:hypothetical protein
MEVKDIIQDNNGQIRYKVGTQVCCICKAKDNIIQFERNTKRKGLPIVEIAFICKSCAVKQGLIKDSVELEPLKFCSNCGSYGHEENNCSG